MTRVAPALALCIALCTALCTLLAPALAHSGPPVLSASAEQKLRRGEIIIKELRPTGGEGVAARVTGLVDAPPAQVWSVIIDCAAYQRFMPRTHKSEVRGNTAAGQKCFVELDMPFPFDNLWSVVNAVHEETADGTFVRRWTLLEGTYSRNDGSWSLYPYDGGQKTLLVYQLDANPDISLPNWLIASAQGGTLPDLYNAVRKRVRKP